MPGTDELGRRVIDQQTSIHRARPRDHSSICDGLSCDAPILPADRSGLDFEQLLSQLAEPQPYLLRPENMQRSALFEQLSGLIELQINFAVHQSLSGQSVPEWLAKLVTLWHAERSSVITFNYDTIVEATFDALSLQNGESERPLMHYQLGPTPLPVTGSFYGGSSRAEPADTMSLIKLHGSTNWYWDESSRTADSIVQIALRSKWSDSEPAYSTGSEKAPGKVPLIVPPTMGKSTFFANPVVTELWHDAYLALMGAERVFVLGYSLPLTDLLVRSMLDSSMIGEKDIWIVNPDGTIADRFEHLGNVRRDFCGFQSPGVALMDRFVQDLPSIA